MENISIFNSWKTVFWSFRKKPFDSLSLTYRNWTTFFKSLFYLLKRISWPWILLHFWVASQHLSIFLTIALIFSRRNFLESAEFHLHSHKHTDSLFTEFWWKTKHFSVETWTKLSLLYSFTKNSLYSREQFYAWLTYTAVWLGWFLKARLMDGKIRQVRHFQRVLHT